MTATRHHSTRPGGVAPVAPRLLGAVLVGALVLAGLAALRRIVVLGGTAAVSDQVAAQLDTFTTDRASTRQGARPC